MAGVEQITKADRNAWHALRKNGKARATLRRLSSTVICINKVSLINVMNHLIRFK